MELGPRDILSPVLQVSNTDCKDVGNAVKVYGQMFREGMYLKALASLHKLVILWKYSAQALFLPYSYTLPCKIREYEHKLKKWISKYNKISPLMKEIHLYSRLVSKQEFSSASRDFIRTKFIC